MCSAPYLGGALLVVDGDGGDFAGAEEVGVRRGAGVVPAAGGERHGGERRPGPQRQRLQPAVVVDEHGVRALHVLVVAVRPHTCQ